LLFQNIIVSLPLGFAAYSSAASLKKEDEVVVTLNALGEPNAYTLASFYTKMPMFLKDFSQKLPMF
jgi:hypothetical protein